MQIAYVKTAGLYPVMFDGGTLSCFDLLVMLKALGDDVQSLSLWCDSDWPRSWLDALDRLPHVRKLAGSPVSERADENAQEWLGIEREGVPLWWRRIPRRGGSDQERRPLMDSVRGVKLDFGILADSDLAAMMTFFTLGIPAVHLLNSLNSVAKLARVGAGPTSWVMRRERTYAVSRFIQREVRERLGLDVPVVNPFINLRRYEGHPGRDRLCTVGYAGGWGKGDGIVAGIIRRLPEVKFLIAGRFDGMDETTEAQSNSVARLRACAPNLECLGRLEDMRTFYSRIDLLLVPSTIQEAFGRVILEAAANGIPAIGNRVGGIPEAIGDSGVTVEYKHDRAGFADTIERYVRAIRRLRDDAAEYTALSRKAQARARDYEREQSVQVEILRRAIFVKKL